MGAKGAGRMEKLGSGPESYPACACRRRFVAGITRLRPAQAERERSGIVWGLQQRGLPVACPSPPHGTVSTIRGGFAAAGLVTLIVSFTVAPSRAEAPSADTIRGWINQLGAEQFAEREAASQSLAAAGPAALGPLAEAARGGDLEVSSRAIDVIRSYLDAPAVAGDERGAGTVTGGEDVPPKPGPVDLAGAVAAALEAERLLESLAEGPAGPAAQIAATTLEYHQLGMHEAAQERLESLGAKISDNYFSASSGRRGLEVVIDSRWRGATEDLRLLPRLRNLRSVGIHGLKADDTTLALLGRLRTLETLQLYGTGVSDEALAALTARAPNTEIDVRKGGKLGVGGQRNVGPCQITQVVAGSAADRAGLQIGDVVLAMGGVPIKNFEGLTDYVGRHGPGEAIEVEVERAVAGKVPQRFTCTVTLDGWD